MADGEPVDGNGDGGALQPLALKHPDGGAGPGRSVFSHARDKTPERVAGKRWRGLDVSAIAVVRAPNIAEEVAVGVPDARGKQIHEVCFHGTFEIDRDGRPARRFVQLDRGHLHHILHPMRTGGWKAPLLRRFHLGRKPEGAVGHGRRVEGSDRKGVPGDDQRGVTERDGVRPERPAIVPKLKGHRGFEGDGSVGVLVGQTQRNVRRGDSAKSVRRAARKGKPARYALPVKSHAGGGGGRKAHGPAVGKRETGGMDNERGEGTIVGGAVPVDGIRCPVRSKECAAGRSPAVASLPVGGRDGSIAVGVGGQADGNHVDIARDGDLVGGERSVQRVIDAGLDARKAGLERDAAPRAGTRAPGPVWATDVERKRACGGGARDAGEQMSGMLQRAMAGGRVWRALRVEPGPGTPVERIVGGDADDARNAGDEVGVEGLRARDARKVETRARKGGDAQSERRVRPAGRVEEAQGRFRSCVEGGCPYDEFGVLVGDLERAGRRKGRVTDVQPWGGGPMKGPPDGVGTDLDALRNPNPRSMVGVATESEDGVVCRRFENGFFACLADEEAGPRSCVGGGGHNEGPAPSEFIGVGESVAIPVQGAIVGIGGIESEGLPFGTVVDAVAVRVAKKRGRAAFLDLLAVGESVSVGIPRKRGGAMDEDFVGIGESVPVGVDGAGIGSVDEDFVGVGKSVAVEISSGGVEAAGYGGSVGDSVAVGVGESGIGAVATDLDGIGNAVAVGVRQIGGAAVGKALHTVWNAVAVGIRLRLGGGVEPRGPVGSGGEGAKRWPRRRGLGVRPDGIGTGRNKTEGRSPPRLAEIGLSEHGMGSFGPGRPKPAGRDVAVGQGERNEGRRVGACGGKR